MENITSTKEKNGYVEIIKIVIVAHIAFGIIRRLTTNIRLIEGIPGSIFHTALFMLGILVYIRSSLDKQGLSLRDCYIGEFNCSIKDFLMAVGFSISVLVLLAVIADKVVPSGIELSKLGYFAINNFITSAIASGITEEIYFRGYLFKRVEVKSDWKMAVIMTSIIFGVGHIGSASTILGMISVFIGTACLGAFFAVLTYKTKSIWKGALFHMCMNTKERFIGFSEDSSLFVLDFGTMPADLQIAMAWFVVAALSMLSIWVFLRKSDEVK